MPGPDLIVPGFYGKLPLAGDFVTRRLPPDFVRFWDRWASRHLAPRLAGDTALFFILAQGPVPATGVAMASADRAGRRFPLTLAAAFPRIPAGLPEASGPWFSALAEAARAAASGTLDPAALDARLRDLPFPAGANGHAAPPLRLWTAAHAPRVVDPDAPGPALDALLAAPAEAG